MAESRREAPGSHAGIEAVRANACDIACVFVVFLCVGLCGSAC